MMRATQQTISNQRPTSTSTETTKLKKSSSSASTKSKMISSLVPPSTYAIKKSRIQSTSKSNKKNNNTNSNKSFKGLSEISSNLNISNNKVNRKITEKDKENPPGKVSAVPVKNIKQKIMGKNQQIEPTFKLNTKSFHMMEKKDVLTQCNDPNNGQKCYYGYKNNITPRQKSEESLLNFSCVLQPSKNGEMALQMFQIGRKLGNGRFGDVYMAREIKSGFALAMKIIVKKQLKQSQMEGQLMQQIKIQTYSNHPNILKMYGFFHDNTKIYLLLELATNGCLFKQIRQKNYFQESLASFYFRQVASGVRYLHSNYVIHRDIKPENILNCFNVLKICDFGWAVYSPIYQRQTFCGTLDYVPPQIVTGEFYDQKVDVWCLGVLCYELCTGRAPFQSKTSESQTYDKILKVEIQFPIYLSPLIVDFIGRILHREPNKRMSLDQVEAHQWMRKYENEAGRMISKDIWDAWIKLGKQN